MVPRNRFRRFRRPDEFFRSMEGLTQLLQKQHLFFRLSDFTPFPNQRGKKNTDEK